MNLNILDGSAIWLTSIVETLAGFSDTDITVYLKAPKQRDLLTRVLVGLPNVRVIFPRQMLSVQQALNQIIRDGAERFDAVVIRGFALAQQAAQRPALQGRLWTYLTDIPQTADEMTAVDKSALEKVVDASAYVLCQTEALRGWIERWAPSAIGRAILLPPMVPTPPRAKEFAKKPAPLRRIVYAGKFAPMWKPLEMIAAFHSAREKFPDLELHVFGDKIHDPPDEPDFKPAVEKALTTTPGVIWQRGVSREELMEQLVDMDVAWAWRCPAFERDTRELSTKVLEYGSVGLPVIVAPGPVNEHVFGVDYPLFARSADDAEQLLHSVDDAADAFHRAATIMREASIEYSLENVRARRLEGPISALRARRLLAATIRRTTLLVAGHDLKFFRQYGEFISQSSNMELIEDHWSGHNAHDPARSRDLLLQADVIFCEWCLGNAVWYSANKLPHQRLVTRFHLQEQFTEFPTRLTWDAVDRVIFVSEHLRREVVARFGWGPEKLTVVPNYVNIEAFDRPKLPRARFNLGVLGICPARKRFDLTLDVLEAVRANDSRFTLFVKSVMPWDYDWLWNRENERAYYESQFKRLQSSPVLADGVVFDPPGDDVPAWFEKVGHILSLSDFESFHLAPAEGAASGAQPWLINRPGAAEIFHPDWVFDDPQKIAAGILNDLDDSGSEAARAFIRSRYRRDLVFDRLTRETFGVDELGRLT
ncbi:MAG: glycosyltransferase [Phycisphaerae bacterium]